MRLLLLTLLVAAATASRLSVGNPQLDNAWKLFKTTYKKDYGSDSKEEAMRRLVWESNVAYINQHNQQAEKGKYSFTLAVNKFSDMTNEEFRGVMNKFRPSVKRNVDVAKFDVDVSALPTQVDWRQKNLVTGVKDQGQCGSCWAFSATGSLEGQHAKATGKLVSLSEQNIMDCDTADNGCAGGSMDGAFEYIKENGGVDTEESYPYEAVQDECQYDPSHVGATLSSYQDIQQGSESDLQKAVATIGPISVAIDASQMSFQYYEGGVYVDNDCSSTALDHGVLVVGYGNEDGQDYWLVKNSWGSSYGENGYIKMARNHDNMCGIATMASYPIV